MSFICAHDVVVAADARPHRTAFFLHGILGSRGNWRGFARKLVEQHPDWRVVTIDLRGHGESHGAPGPHTVAACAADLRRLAGHLGLRPEAVVGHSFGGKVALMYAREHGSGLKAVWSLDSPPGADRSRGDDHQVARVIAAIRSTPMPAPHRRAVIGHFEQAGFDAAIAGWMTTNLRRAADGFRWRFDLGVIDPLLSDYRALDLYPFIMRPPSTLAVHLVLGGRSDRWAQGEGARLAAMDRVAVHWLPDAGHWVHIDDPTGLRAALSATFG